MGILDWEGNEVTIQTQAELLSLNRTSLYYVPVPVSEAELGC